MPTTTARSAGRNECCEDQAKGQRVASSRNSRLPLPTHNGPCVFHEFSASPHPSAVHCVVWRERESRTSVASIAAGSLTLKTQKPTRPSSSILGPRSASCQLRNRNGKEHRFKKSSSEQTVPESGAMGKGNCGCRSGQGPTNGRFWSRTCGGHQSEQTSSRTAPSWSTFGTTSWYIRRN